MYTPNYDIYPVYVLNVAWPSADTWPVAPFNAWGMPIGLYIRKYIYIHISKTVV